METQAQVSAWFWLLYSDSYVKDSTLSTITKKSLTLLLVKHDTWEVESINERLIL